MKYLIILAMLISINCLAESPEAVPTPIVTPTPVLTLPEPFEEAPQAEPTINSGTEINSENQRQSN